MDPLGLSRDTGDSPPEDETDPLLKRYGFALEIAPDLIDVGETVIALTGGMPSTGGAVPPSGPGRSGGGFGSGGGKGGPSCFVAGTPVQMADGATKPIEEVQEGDLVLSRSESGDESGTVVAKRVVKTMVHEAPATLVLTLSSGEVVETTGEHPFYVSGKGFVEAKDLGIGTSLVTRAGPQVTVVGIARREQPATVYNFTVEQTHTYFVGANGGGVWVHNKGPKPTWPDTA